jgi:hypothetical protein
LRDAGTGFTHPRNPRLYLDDFYFYPDLITQTPAGLQPVESALPKKIASNDVIESLLKAKRSLVVGLDDIGKAALSKMLTFDLYHQRGMSPLLLLATAFKGNDPEESYSTCVQDAVALQYGDQLVDKYLQLAAGQKVLVVDDWPQNSIQCDRASALVARDGESFRIYRFIS